MQVLNETQARTLLFVATVNRGGYKPTRVEVSTWLKSPEPRAGRPGRMTRRAGVSPMLHAQLGSITRMNELFQKNLFANLGSVLGSRPEYEPDVPAEDHLDHLIRLRWLEESGTEGLQLTRLGQALLRTAEADVEGTGTADVVVLGADNELSYPTLVSRMAEAHGGMVIDPYVRAEQVLAVLTYTTISRVLLSEKLQQADRAAVATLVSSFQSEHHFEVRVAPKHLLHDRYVICDEFVNTIGTSLNTVGKQHATVLSSLPALAAEGVRDQSEKWWTASTLLAQCGPVTEGLAQINAQVTDHEDHEIDSAPNETQRESEE